MEDQADSRHSNAATVLVVDDAVQMRRLLRHGLGAAGYQVALAATGEEALDEFFQQPADLVVLDLAMPGIGGLETCKRLRALSTVPIIVLSVRDSEADKVAALDLGADDYLTKPFSLGELLARIRAALRRVHAPSSAEPVVTAGPLQIDLAAHRVTRDGERVHLTPTEFKILAFLVTHADRVVTHDVLLQAIWHNRFGPEPHYLHVYVNQLRRKLEGNPAEPRLILTELGVGYRFRSNED